MFVQEDPVVTLWLMWVFTLPAGPLLGSFARKYWHRISVNARRLWVVVALLHIALAGLMAFSPWSLRGFWTDAVNLVLAYGSVWVLCSLPYRRAAWFAENGRVIAGVPSVLLAVAIYTFLPFALAVDGIVPDKIVYLRKNLVAQIYQFGWETMNTDKVNLVYRPVWFPVVERRVHSWANSMDTCDLGRLEVRADVGSDVVRTMCPGKPGVLDRVAIP